VIAFRFLRTVLGWTWIVADTMISATAIGISGETEFSERVLRAWARRFLRVAGARVIVRREAKLEPDRSYIFVSNHTSNLDVAAILSVNDHPMRFIAKKELSWIPLFGWAARRMGHVFIDRKDRSGATKAIRERIGRGLRGASLFFFAEGTRSVADELLPFKKGAAVAALETHLDCVPIAVAGARAVLKPKGLSLFQPGTVAVVFGEPIPSSSHALDRRDELVAEQRTAVEDALRKARALLAGKQTPEPGPHSGSAA
jgi:1-acyl-sn-glycerol-3-phosphate acyltransferase